MRNAAMTFRLHAPWVHSLKEKRMIVKSLTARLQNKFHEEFFKTHEVEFEKLIATSDCLGYGVECDLAILLEEARFEVYGEEEE